LGVRFVEVWPVHTHRVHVPLKTKLHLLFSFLLSLAVRSNWSQMLALYSFLTKSLYMYYDKSKESSICILGNYTIFLVQFGINLHEWVFQKAEIVQAALASAISAFWKSHKCKLIPNWMRKTVCWLLFNNMINMKKIPWRKCRKVFPEAIFSHLRKLFSNFLHKMFSSSF